MFARIDNYAHNLWGVNITLDDANIRGPGSNVRWIPNLTEEEAHIIADSINSWEDK